MNKRSILTILIFNAVLCTSAFADPKISSVVRKGNQNYVTINGFDFGGAPNVQIFDNFDHPGASNGASIDTSQAFDGHWMAITLPKYDSLSYSGENSALVYSYEDGNKKLSSVLQVELIDPSSDAFISYVTRTRPETSFPGKNHYTEGNNEGFPSGSSWKFAWLFDLDYHGYSSDLAAVTYTGYGKASISGNDFSMTAINDAYTWWDKNNWNHFSLHLNADESMPTATGSATLSIVNPQFGNQQFSYQKPVYDIDGPTEKVFRTVTIPGWIAPSDRTSEVLYDDLYISTGPNAAARVAFTNNQSYASSDKISLQRIMKWDDKKVNAFIDFSVFSEGEDIYMHVFDGQGNLMSSGLKVNTLNSTITNNDFYTRIYGAHYGYQP